MASKSPTPLSKFISSSPAFSVDQYYGLNSQPRLMSAELISSLNEHRAKLLDEYINNAHGSNDEIIKTIENVDSSLDPIQVQWLRDGVEKIIVSDPQSKTSIAFKAQIMLSDLATNDESENLDFEYIYNFVKDKSVFSMKGRYLHETIATVLTNEINELEKANLSKKQKSDRINQLIEATKLSSIDEIVVNLKSAIEHRLDNIIEDVEEFQNRQSELEKLDNYASVNKLSFNQSNNNVTDQHIELIASDENLMDNALGSIEMKSEGKSFNYIKSQNLSKEIRKIMETNKITINTEFRSIGFGITQYENIGGKIKTTSTTKSKVGKFIDNLV